MSEEGQRMDDERTESERFSDALEAIDDEFLRSVFWSMRRWYTDQVILAVVRHITGERQPVAVPVTWG